MYNVVNTLAPSFLIGSSSILRVTRTTMKSRMSCKFSQIQLWNAELAFHDFFYLLDNYLRYFDDLLALR